MYHWPVLMRAGQASLYREVWFCSNFVNPVSFWRMPQPLAVITADTNKE